MSSDQLNRWLTLGANLGVIAGIVFLGLELRQNADLMRAQSRAEMSRDTVNLLSLHVNDPVYVDVLSRGLRGEELNAVERSQFRRTYNSFIWHWNNLEYQHRVELYPESEYRLQMDIITSDISRLPGFKTHWCDNKAANASAELIEAVEAGSNGNFCKQ